MQNRVTVEPYKSIGIGIPHDHCSPRRGFWKHLPEKHCQYCLLLLPFLCSPIDRGRNEKGSMISDSACPASTTLSPLASVLVAGSAFIQIEAAENGWLEHQGCGKDQKDGWLVKFRIKAKLGICAYGHQEQPTHRAATTSSSAMTPAPNAPFHAVVAPVASPF